MHRGRHYPYADQYWECEVQFWPGFVPRKVFAEILSPNGDSWDLVGAGVVTDTMLPDFFLPGDCYWSYLDPFGAWSLEVYMHKVVTFPKQYSAIARLALATGHANVISAAIGPEVRTFGGWAFTLDSGADPPFFNGTIPRLNIRAATWGEV